MSSIYKTNNKGPSIDPLVRKGFKYNGYINALYGGYKKVIKSLMYFSPPTKSYLCRCSF